MRVSGYNIDFQVDQVQDKYKNYLVFQRVVKKKKVMMMIKIKISHKKNQMEL